MYLLTRSVPCVNDATGAVMASRAHRVVLLLAVAAAVAVTATTAPRYGFVGVGVMSSAIIRGTCTLPDVPASSIVLSPRGAARSAELASEFPDLVTVATSNQDVVDSCDIVFIGVLPKQAEEVLRGLRFDARHTVVSLVSTCAMPLLQEACAPATQIVRAIPLPSVAGHNGVCIMTPPHPDVTALFDRLGTCVAVEVSRAPQTRDRTAERSAWIRHAGVQ